MDKLLAELNSVVECVPCAWSLKVHVAVSTEKNVALLLKGNLGLPPLGKLNGVKLKIVAYLVVRVAERMRFYSHLITTRLIKLVRMMK